MMKRACFVLALVATLILAGNVVAQNPPEQGGDRGPGGPPGGRRMNVDVRLEHLSQELSLTEDQKAKLKPILQDELKKMQALHQDTALAPEDMHIKMREIHQATDKQIRPLLTAEQQKKFDAARKRDDHHGHGGPPPGQAPPAGEQPTATPQQ